MTKETSFFTGIGLGLLAAVVTPYLIDFFGWVGGYVVAALSLIAAFVHGVRSRGTWTSIFRWNAALVCALPPFIAGVSTFVGNPGDTTAKAWLLVAAILFTGFIAGSWSFTARETAAAATGLNKERVARYFFVFPAVFLAGAIYRALSADMVVLFAGLTCTLYLVFAAYVVYRSIVEERLLDLVFVMFVAVPMIVHRYLSSTNMWAELTPALKVWPRALEVAVPGYLFALMVIGILVWLRVSPRSKG